MTAMELAIRRGDWERLALLLLLGVDRAARKLPPETLTELLDILSAAEPGGRRRGG